MIQRKISPFIRMLADCYSTVMVMGPRQSGKTTLVRDMFPEYEYINLEAENIRFAALSDPRSFLRHGKKKLILDEVQHLPSLLTYIQEYADEHKIAGQFVITGSHQP